MSALDELRARLEDGLAKSGLTKSQLGTRSGRKRTAVSEAFSAGKPVPSAETVAGIARVLKLPVDELLDLRRTAAQEAGAPPAEGPGRPVGDWNPHDLEVHPAGPGEPVSRSGGAARAAHGLPGYVPRAHDQVLAAAVSDVRAGRSRLVLLVGSSSTGKTRACWEAVQPLAAESGWRLWHPFHPTRAEAALEDLHQVAPRTVVWLNEAQHYLGDREAGERIAAALHNLLVAPERGPVLVLGTLWTEYAKEYTALPAPGGRDPFSRVRELLAGRTLTVPEMFDGPALAAATRLAEAGDELLTDALTRARDHGRVTQDLAGAPALLDRYNNASPGGKALLEAAMDARRLDVGLHLPQAFLTDAATDYLSDTDYDHLADDWAEQAYAEVAEPVHGKQAPLRHTNTRPPRNPAVPAPAARSTPSLAGPLLRLADYLEQHGRTHRHRLCPPASFWHAAHTHLTDPDDLNTLTSAAFKRHRLRWARHLGLRAAAHGAKTDVLTSLAEWREDAEDWAGALTLALEAADHGDTGTLGLLARWREDAGDRAGAEALGREAADRGDANVLAVLAVRRGLFGDWAGAEPLAREAADHGDPFGLTVLAVSLAKDGDLAGAENLAREAAELGDSLHLVVRAVELAKEGNRAGAKALVREAADRGDLFAQAFLAGWLAKDGDLAGAETMMRKAADHRDTRHVAFVAQWLAKEGDLAGAKAMAREAADRGEPFALTVLAEWLAEAGDLVGAETMMRKAADHGYTRALVFVVHWLAEAGDQVGAETLAREAADRGNTDALTRLAEWLARDGDLAGAETMMREAADRGNTDALAFLAEWRVEAGDQVGAETLALEAADRGLDGDSQVLIDVLRALGPWGLEPDGTATPPWE
ncbi:hypothetical protein [Streptomyces cyaneofuscatus]|uniref:hypothetical protein n=1 Tax=Streptomyces cyaneofuscatus TaxID=66883 RepID=UPI0036631F95